MGKIVVSVSFRQQTSTISKRKMIEVDLEIVEEFEFLVVFDAVSVQFSSFRFSSITLNNERTRYALLFKQNVAAFCFRNTSSFFCFHHLRFQATYVYF